MITKENCNLNVRVVVNDKATKWNSNMGTSQNGLVCFVFKHDGVIMSDELEVIPGTKLTILSKPKRFNESGNQVKFKIDGSEIVYSAWWVAFKHKVDLL